MSDSTEIARYASGNVKRKDGRAIGDLIATYPELNTEKAVGGLIYMVTHHGESVGLWAEEQISEYSLDEFLLVLEFLYDTGLRVGADSTFMVENEDTREYVPSLLGLLRDYKEAKASLDPDIESVDQLNWLVEALGGLKTLGYFDSPARLTEALDDYRFLKG
jgi:hypothetical protein